MSITRLQGKEFLFISTDHAGICLAVNDGVLELVEDGTMCKTADELLNHTRRFYIKEQNYHKYQVNLLADGLDHAQFFIMGGEAASEEQSEGFKTMMKEQLEHERQLFGQYSDMVNEITELMLDYNVVIHSINPETYEETLIHPTDIEEQTKTFLDKISKKG